jgi:hypothetical protein
MHFVPIFIFFVTKTTNRSSTYIQLKKLKYNTEPSRISINNGGDKCGVWRAYSSFLLHAQMHSFLVFPFFSFSFSFRLLSLEFLIRGGGRFEPPHHPPKSAREQQRHRV